MNLQNYVSTVFAASILGAVCATAAGGAFEKYIRYLASLVCILLIVHPFRDLSFESLQTPDTEASAPAVSGETLESLASSLAEEEISRVIASALSAETGITGAAVCIDIDWTAEEPLIHEVMLILPPEEAERAEEAAAWVEKTYGVPGRIVDGGGES